MNKLLSKVLAMLVLTTSLANPLPVFSMNESSTGLPVESVGQYTVQEAVYTSDAISIAEADDFGDDLDSAYNLKVGKEITGKIDNLLDTDYFKFIAPSSGLYVIEKSGDTKLTGNFSDSKANYFKYETDKDFTIRYYFKENQTYYFRLYNADLNITYAQTGPYRISISQLKDDYGNDDFSTATEMNLDTEYHAVSEAENEADYFRFVPDTTGVYAFESYGECSTKAELYDSNYNYINKSSYEGINQNYFLVSDLEANKTYYLKSSSYTLDTLYTFSATKLTDDYGNNPSSASLIKIGEDIHGEITNVKDFDYFKFIPTVSGQYKIEGIGNIGLYCKFENGDTAFNVTDTNKKFSMFQLLNANQVYYFCIYSQFYGDKDKTDIGEYNISISETDDDYGCTFDSATNLEISEQIEVVAEGDGDFDYFKFIPETSGIYAIESSGSANTSVKIFDSAKSEIAGDYSSGIESNFYYASWLNSGEVYYIETYSYSFGVPYKIFVNPIDDDYGNDVNSAAEMALDKVSTGEINYINDHDLFKFTPEESGPYTFESMGSIDVGGELIGCTINRSISSTNKNFSIEYNLNAGQTYYLDVFYDGLPYGTHFIDLPDKDNAIVGTYEVKISRLVDDHGNSFDTATNIKVGEEISSLTQFHMDYDYFKFIPEISGMYCIEGIDTKFTYAEIFNSEHSSIWSNSRTEGNFCCNLWLDANENYYFITYAKRFNRPYKVKVSLLKDDFGHDNDSARKLVLDETVYGEINYENDCDYFKFTPDTTGIYMFKSVGYTDVVGNLSDIVINDDISIEDRNFKIVHTLIGGETYYLQVYDAEEKVEHYYFKRNHSEYGIKVTQKVEEHPNPPWFIEENILAFEDKNLEASIREIIGKPEGNIIKNDVSDIKYLDLSGKGISDITPLSNFSNLIVIDLRNNKINDLAPLNNLTNLNRLYLSNNQISNLAPLSNLTNLTTLYLNNNKIEDLTPLSNLTNLKCLILFYNQINNLTPLSNLTNLTNLNLCHNKISDIAPIENFIGLTITDLSCNEISDISSLSKLTNLTELYLSYCNIPDLTPLSKLTRLSWLSLSCNEIKASSLLNSLPNLTNLFLNNNQKVDVSSLSNAN